MKKTWASYVGIGLAGLLLLSAVLTGCGGREDRRKDAGEYVGDGYAAEAVYDEYVPAAAEEYEEAAEGGTMLTAASDIPLRTAQKDTDKLIYSGSVTLQTLEYEKTIGSIHTRIADAGGFIQYEDMSDGNDTWYYSGSSYRGGSRSAQIQARIPSEQFRAFMDALDGDGQVMNRHVNVDNISQTYAETEASVKAYEIEQERLLDMMDRAETIEDMIAVEARLSEVEAELSSYKTSLASMDRDVEYSTVTISVEEVREYTEEKDDSTFISRLKDTVKSSWSGFLWFMEGLLHVIIRLLPFLIVILVVFFIVRALNRKFEDKRRARKAARAAKKAQKAMEKQQKIIQRYQQPTKKAGQTDEQRTGKDL